MTRARPGHEQVAGRGVEHVAAAGDAAPFSSAARSIDAGQQPRVGHRLAVDAQPGDPAVGEDGQPDVGEALRRSATSNSLRASPATAAARDQGRPLGRGQLGGRRVALGPARLDRHLGRVVAGEEGGVDDDAADDARRAEPDDRAGRCRGSRRRRVSQPSMIWPLLPNVCGWKTGASGLIRFSRSANSSSLAQMTLPPSCRAARSGHWSCCRCS